MTVNVAISGFGRIGRNVLRAIAESGRTDVNVVAINDIAAPETLAHMFRYDSTHGPFAKDVTLNGDMLNVGTGDIKVMAVRNPAEAGWGALGVDVVMECTGIFTDKDKAQAHIDAGAKRVLVSAPSKGADATIVYGVNHTELKPEHTIVSNASCTTNCLAPVAKVLHEIAGIEQGFMTTVHAYTSDQRILDAPHSDPRRARSAAVSMIPTSTGAARAVGLVMPELVGKLDGTAIRVPTPNVSMIDLKVIPSRNVSVEDINAAMKHASENDMKGVLHYNTDPLVSIDFNHHPASSAFDSTQTQIVDGRLIRVLSWYDNEWGFSNRMSDTAVALAELG
ncbi:MAG: type I glyceraldehyde-3-phosphate dehydrogenase [Pseudomonadota bacterium]